MKEEKEEAFLRVSGGNGSIFCERVQGGIINGAEKRLVDYLQYGELIDARIDELFGVKIELINCISKLPDANHRILLLAYYVNCQTWEKVADEMGCSERWVYKLHKRVIKQIADDNKINIIEGVTEAMT